MDDPNTHVQLSTSEAKDLDDALFQDSSLRIAIASSNMTVLGAELFPSSAEYLLL